VDYTIQNNFSGMNTLKNRIIMTKEQQIKQLTIIPGVGKSIATDLWKIDIRCVDDLKGKSPEKLFELSNKQAGMVQDRCLLYVFRCAVYYSETPEYNRDLEKLKWWNWKDTKSKMEKLGK
jgi:hypothetical protein